MMAHPPASRPRPEQQDAVDVDPTEDDAASGTTSVDAAPPEELPPADTQSPPPSPEEIWPSEPADTGAEAPPVRPSFPVRRFLLTFLILVVMALGTVAGVYWIQAVEKPEAPAPAPARVAVETVRITPRTFTHRLRALGSVKAFREAALSVKVSGPVARVPEGIELGAHVNKGTVLAEIDPTPFRIEVSYRKALLARAQAELRRAKAVTIRQKALIAINREKLRLARAEWERLKGLFRRALTAQQEMERSELLVRRSQEELERAESALEEAEGQEAMATANVEAARAELSRAQQALEDTQVRVPFTGVIAEKVVTVGEMVSPGTVLFRLVDLDVVRVLIRAPADDIGLLHPGLTAEVRVEGFSEPFRGRVAYVGPRADIQSRTFPVEVLVENRGPRRLLPGMFARVSIPVRTYPSAILIPQSSVVNRAPGPAVFVIDPESGVARRRPITIERTF
ncbi:MAG: efflux RND transporter periplasmic adaptor subunit, partial [Nitrospinota bacterium]